MHPVVDKLIGRAVDLARRFDVPFLVLVLVLVMAAIVLAVAIGALVGAVRFLVGGLG